MSLTATGNPGYPEFLAQLKASIRRRQYQALRAVNRELVGVYWEIGQAIHQKQEELGWGKAVVETLARDLQAEFPGRNGFSAQNLWLMRQFYREYNELPKLQPLVREISWAKNLVILARVKDSLEREFYLRATARFGWTKAVLQHQIDNQSYQKYLLNQTNFDQALLDDIKAQAALAVKDHYTFDKKTRLSASSSAAVSTKPSLNTHCARPDVRSVWPATAWLRSYLRIIKTTCPARKALPGGWSNGRRGMANDDRLLDDADAYQSMARALNPYGDGLAAARIRDRLLEAAYA